MHRILKRGLTRVVDLISKTGRVNMCAITQKRLGILQYKNNQVSGEHYFITKVLPALLKGTESPILFDVGLNEGAYSRQLTQVFPDASLYGFEPVATTLARARTNLAEMGHTKLENMAVSEANGEIEIYDYSESQGSGHASIYEGVLTEQHGADQVTSQTVKCVTLNQYAKDHDICRIDFVKIDTEGHELSALKGCKELLRSQRVKIVQFEFNEMNVISRCFLRDFYVVLDGFSLYRLREDGLLPLGQYNTINEIFKFQNIVAISRNLSERAAPFEIENPWK